MTPTTHADAIYLGLAEKILRDGARKTDRTGTGTKSLFGPQIEFDLSHVFPLLTTKKLHTRSIFYELIWMLMGDTNVRYLQDNKVTIWDEWADENGDLGPVYGAQWRSWKGADGKVYDQITNVIERIRQKPDDRRLIVSAWKVDEIDKMKLPPCHCLFQFYVADDRLSCKLTQRSCDYFLGVPFNIASYAALTHMVAQVTGYKPGKFVWSGGDVHVYRNHFSQMETQIGRLAQAPPMPRLKLNPDVKDIFDFRFEDIEVTDYHPLPAIKGEVAV